MEEMLDPEFKKQFWDWFDELDLAEKNKFKYYPSDMAELFFYNKIYRHTITLPSNSQLL